MDLRGDRNHEASDQFSARAADSRHARSGQCHGFGTAHFIGLNMAFCDGSVRTINYTIDPTVHRCLGSRNDGMVINAKKL